jgi:hypothetical protein
MEDLIETGLMEDLFAQRWRRTFRRAASVRDRDNCREFRYLWRRQQALRLVGVAGDTSAKREQKAHGTHVAADRSVNKRPGDCARLGDFEFAVAVADTNDLGKLVKQIGLETPEAFWAPARVSADAWLELMGYRRSLVADWTVLLIGHGFHHKLALPCVPRDG